MSGGKERFSTQLPIGLADAVRATVIELQGEHPGVTLSSFTADALTAAVEGVRAGTFRVATGAPVQLRRGRTLADSTGMTTSLTHTTPQEEP